LKVALLHCGTPLAHVFAHATSSAMLRSMIAFALDAAFIFFNFLLSIAATVFATKAIEEIKVKQREEYNRLSVLSDTLQYEVDH
jgi:predicted Kef-type K+ transport protein